MYFWHLAVALSLHTLLFMIIGRVSLGRRWSLCFCDLVSGIFALRNYPRKTADGALCVKYRMAASLAFLMAGPVTAQNCGWSHIDHQLTYDESGIWNTSTYRNLMNGLTIAQVVGALWEGSDSRLGLTMWQGIDSQIIGNVGAEVGKRIFRRERPAESNNPCNWFSDSHHSFPSTEATSAAALVTPYILEYGKDHPMVYGLVALPLYVGVGRLKAQAHWQTDVLAGWALGAAAGVYAHNREIPILVSILPHGITVGLRKEF